MKNSLIIISILLLSGLSVNAQLYSVAAPIQIMNHTTNDNTLHDYVEITNLSGGPLPMKWEARFGTLLEWPFQWTALFTDPDSVYNPIIHGDTASFVLQDTAFSLNQLIIGVDHYGFTGTSDIRFKIYPLSNPADSMFIGFNITVTQYTGVVTNYIVNTNDLVYPNPSNDGIFNLNQPFKKALIYNSFGAMVYESSSKKIDLTEYANGIYFLHTETEEGIWSKNKLIKH